MVATVVSSNPTKSNWKNWVLDSMVQGIENYEREKALYDGIVVEYLELEDIVRNQSNTGGPYQSTLHTALPKVLAYLEWWWKCALRGPVLRCVCCNAAGPALPGLPLPPAPAISFD